VPDTLVAYGEIARAHRRSFACPVVAIAGSNGKTTTKELVADVLAERFTVLRTEGNLNNLIGVPAMMLRMSEAYDIAVIEIGTNAPGEIGRLCEILEPTHGLITNIGREHLELLGSIEGVAEEEGALFDYLRRSGGIAFVNLDDPFTARLGRSLERTVTYGRKRNAAVRGAFGRLDANGAPSVRITDARNPARVREFALQLRMPGVHAAINALAAATVGLTFRVPPTVLKRTLERFEPILYRSGYARLATMRATCGATVLNDTYNANPDSVATALATLRALKPGKGGRRIAVLADMKELGASSESEHARIGEEIATMGKIDLALFLGEQMVHAHRVLVDRSDGAVESRHFERKDLLARALLDEIGPADVVLVKGSRGMKMEEVVHAVTQGES
jgi:UDP-N-acetylmuramoyl-tripeptide--D-alanyl-D-alanine ligase